MSNSFVGSLVGEVLDEIHHVIELVLLGPDPYYPLCSEIDVAMILPCLMLVILGPGAMVSDPLYPCSISNLASYSHLLRVMIRQPRSDNSRDHSR